MHNLLKSCIIACALVQATMALYPMAGSGNTQSLATLFLESRLVKQDPQESMKCFADYMMESRQESEGFSKTYNQCLIDAKAEREAVENEMTDIRKAISESAQAVCSRLTTCEGLNTTLDVFDCHARIGANNTKAVYSISGNASEYTTLIQEKYRTIDLRHVKCSKAAERHYVESTAINYRNLKSCLSGHGTQLPTTTTTTTTTPHTPAPISSTTEAEIIPGILEEEPTTLPDTEQIAKLIKLFK